MTSIDNLIEPISAENPCGDYPYHPKLPEELKFYQDFVELDRLLSGKRETVLSQQGEKPEEPKWGVVEEHCLDIFVRCKHLHVAVALTLAWLRLRGLPGFRDGISLIRGLVERYWDQVHPMLDPEERNDPTERINILAAMSVPAGTFGDLMNFSIRLRQAPLCHSHGDPISASDIVKAETGTPGAEAGASEDDSTDSNIKSIAEIKGMFAASSSEEIDLNRAALAEALSCVKLIDAALTRVVGPEYCRSWSSLIETLEDIQLRLGRYAPATDASTHPESDSAVSVAAGSGQKSRSGLPTAAGIQSRDDVLRALETICAYYHRAEPSSPVPLLLQRAKRLVNKDFMDLVKDLTPDAVAALQIIVGEAENANASGKEDA